MKERLFFSKGEAGSVRIMSSPACIKYKTKSKESCKLKLSLCYESPFVQYLRQNLYRVCIISNCNKQSPKRAHNLPTTYSMETEVGDRTMPLISSRYTHVARGYLIRMQSCQLLHAEAPKRIKRLGKCFNFRRYIK